MKYPLKKENWKRFEQNNQTMYKNYLAAKKYLTYYMDNIKI